LGVSLRSGSPAAAELVAALRPYSGSALLAAMENNRIALYTRVLEQQFEAAARIEDSAALVETIAAQRKEIEQLTGRLRRRPVTGRLSPLLARLLR
jgi:hypothetical protein